MDWRLNRLGVVAGRYRGLLVGPGVPPDLEMAVNGVVTGRIDLRPDEGGWLVEGELGPELLTEGTQTLEIRVPDGPLLDAVTVVCGLGAPEDLRADLAALRAELGILKAALRRHLRETSGDAPTGAR